MIKRDFDDMLNRAEILSKDKMSPALRSVFLDILKQVYLVGRQDEKIEFCEKLTKELP